MKSKVLRSLSMSMPLVLISLALLRMAYLSRQGVREQEIVFESLETGFATGYARAGAEALAGLPAKAIEIPKYSEPPVPGKASPLDEALDQDDAQALRAIVADPAAGLSPAGLPRQVLAAMKLRALEPAAGDREAGQELVDLVTRRYPSVLTSMVLQRSHAPEAELRDWQEFEQLRAKATSASQSGWICDGGECWWLQDAGDHWAYVRPSQVRSAMESLRTSRDAPGDFVALLSTAGNYPRTPEAPDLVAFAPVAAGNGLRVDVCARAGGTFRQMVERTRENGQFTLAGSLATIAAGLLLLLFSLRREYRLNEMKSQFVASVSHELRTPVASIRLMAEALDAGKVEPATAAEFHRLIAREGARLSTLVGNLLDHARIEQGRRTWNIAPCALAELTADTVRVMEPLAKDREIALKLEAADIDSAVDAGAIQQALVNLLDNAIKFSPVGGTVTITLASDDVSRTWELRVNDQGQGIPRSEQRRIFERFYRIGNELRRETQGAGIGLSLVHSIARAHRGQALVESEPGKGSTFILRIPLS